jgi:predicted transglutaminase-like cysteine proteinase
MPTRRSDSLLLAFLGAAFIALAIAAAGELGFSRSVTPGAIAHYVGKFGAGARTRLEGWKSFVREADPPARLAEAAATAVPGAAGAPPARELELLERVNRFFNLIPEITDLQHWGIEDYWATPAEMLSSRGADCEDFTIAKYFTLKELGVPIKRLRLVYVKAVKQDVQHMVLAYFPDPGSEPLILDNLVKEIRPAAQRSDLVPVYSFNDEDLLYFRPGAAAVKVSSAQNRRWRELLQKLERELAL